MSLAREVVSNFGGVSNQFVAKFATVDTLIVKEETVLEGDLDVTGDVSASNVTASGDVSASNVSASGDVSAVNVSASSEIEATGQITGGSFFTAGNVTCNQLNYTTLNPDIFAYTTVASYNTLVTQTIPPGEFVWCTDKAALFRGLVNPADTTILPSGSPWGANGFLTMTLRINQNGTNIPTITVLKNELYVGTTINILPTLIQRSGPGQYTLEFPNQVPYDGIVADVTPSYAVLANVATIGVSYIRAVGPPTSVIFINARDYAGAFSDLSPGAPDNFTFTILFVPRAVF